MVWARKGLLAAVFGSVLATMGCCYHAASFGKERDVCWGEVGCGSGCRSRCACQSCGPCAPGAPGALPGSVKAASGTVVAASYVESEMPTEFRRADRNGSEFPIYVLPQDSVQNATVISPQPLPSVSRPK